MKTKGICTCVCHTDKTQRHCRELSCMPCCIVCHECGSNITLGKMIPHMIDSHGIVVPPASPEKIEEACKLMADLYNLL
jgi:hypothetical protein